MRMKISRWLGREFVVLSCEGTASLTPTEEAREIFHRLDHELKRWGLSLEETVRTRLWARDRECRNVASEERFKVLRGKARSASSSYIAPGHFESDARIAVELLAMRPARPGLEKLLKEYEPPIIPLRYLIYDSVVFLSGVTAVLPTLADQVADILAHISGSLTDARSSWDKVVWVSFFLHRSQKLEALKELFQKTVRAEASRMEYAFVDGYSGEGKLIEIEVTATV